MHDEQPAGATEAKSRLESGSPRLLSSDALVLFAVALALLLTVSGVVGTIANRVATMFSLSAYGRSIVQPLSVMVTEVCAIFLPALLWSRARRHSAALALGLALPPRSSDGRRRLLAGILGGALLGAAWFYVVATLLEPLLERVLPVPASERQQLLQLLRPSTGLRPLWLDLACFAVMPALCEEVLFRGAILTILTGVPASFLPRSDVISTRRRYVALVLCSVFFGIFHLSFSKVIPTALLGLGFGAAVLLSGSLWAAIAMHTTNNALVIVLVRVGGAEPGTETLTRGDTAAGVLYAFLTVLVGGAGYLLLSKAGQGSDGSSEEPG